MQTRQAFAPELVRQNNSLRRELNLTQAAEYPKDNVITEGNPKFSQVGQVSVEAKLANELGIKIGDRLDFSLPEGTLQATVINLRSVEWESLAQTFSLSFHRKAWMKMQAVIWGVLCAASRSAKMVQLIQQFSNTVFIDVGGFWMKSTSGGCIGADYYRIGVVGWAVWCIGVDCLPECADG